MVSWADLFALGAKSRSAKDGKIVIEAPQDVLDDVAQEVRKRAPMMVTPKLLDVPRSGACDACAEPLPPHRGGWCPLCTAAREVALRGRSAA